MEKTSTIKLAMEKISDIRTLLAMWPSRRVIADDTGATVDAVNKWPVQKSIPARFHAALIESAQRNGIMLTAEILAQLHDHRTAQPSSLEAPHSARVLPNASSQEDAA